MKTNFLLPVIFLFCATVTFAQEKQKFPQKKLMDMPVDMPDETHGTDLVKKGEWHWEMAYLHNFYKEGSPSSVGQGLLRHGVSKHLELRLLVETGSELQRYIEQTVQSTYPASLSAKIMVLQDHPMLPDITLVAYLQLPFFKTIKNKKSYWSPVLLVAFENEYGEKWKLDYNLGVQQEAFSTRWAMLGNASLHYKLFNQLEIFSEYFAQYQPGENPQHNVGAGLGYQLNNFIELFAMTGSTIGYQPSNHYYNGGAAFRIP